MLTGSTQQPNKADSLWMKTQRSQRHLVTCSMSHGYEETAVGKPVLLAKVAIGQAASIFTFPGLCLLFRVMRGERGLEMKKAWRERERKGKSRAA